ncbi:MAG: 1-acyl-sn-glycerol-3-phosphate acyltransferase [Firmicutes bacterium]|nr:1-acyl-sn-glycerol-3-phosphate acyltransferase [Bacillota bacterium]
MYEVAVAIIRVIVRIVFGLHVEGLENIPKEGGAVIAPNHTTWFDPVAVACAVKRPVHFMGKAELFRNRFLSRLFRRAYAFPVKRGLADREAIRTAIDRLTDGNLVGIFPEGTRVRPGEEQPLQGGAVYIAAKAGVPIIPVGISGVTPLRPFKKIVVRVGEPVNLGGPRRIDKTEIDEVSLAISKQIADLLRRNLG